MANKYVNPQTKWRQRLKRLFTGQVIIRKIPSQQRTLKTFDHDSVQKTLQVNKYSKIFQHTAIQMGYKYDYGQAASRLQLFNDYQAMDKDPIISSALDLYSQQATIKDESG